MAKAKSTLGLDPEIVEDFHGQILRAMTWGRIARWAKKTHHLDRKQSRQYFDAAVDICLESFDMDRDRQRAVIAEGLCMAISTAMDSDRPLQAIQGYERLIGLLGVGMSDSEMILRLNEAGYEVRHPELEALGIQIDGQAE